MRCATWKRRVKAEINEMSNSQASSLELGQREDGDVIDGKRDPDRNYFYAGKGR